MLIIFFCARCNTKPCIYLIRPLRSVFHRLRSTNVSITAYLITQRPMYAPPPRRAFVFAVGYKIRLVHMIYVVAYYFSSLIHLHRPYLGFPVLFYQYTLFIDYANDVAVGILLENYAFIRHRSASVQKLDILHSNGRYFG